MNDCDKKDERAADAVGTIKARFIPLELVAIFLTVSLATAKRMHAGGEIPKPVRFGRRVVRWDVEDLKAWADRIKPNGNRYTREEWAAVRAAQTGK